MQPRAACSLQLACVDHTKAATVSTESIASSSAAHAASAASCPSCGAPLAGDQRYCLECGERRVTMSSLLFGGSPPADALQASSPSPPATPPSPPGLPPSPGAPQRNQTLTVIAGVGVLLLAMGVGVLIGRGGASKQATAPAQVITVATGAGSSGPAAGSSGEASFTSDWPEGTSGYTVQLQTLAQTGTSVSAIESAKSAASAKGAKAVGALKSEEFTSLSAGSYVVYSGVYHKRAEAEKALAGLRKSFAGAKVIKVSNGGSASKEAEPSASSSHGGVGSSESNPAPASVLNTLKGAKGKSYEEKSKQVPDVLKTG